MEICVSYSDNTKARKDDEEAADSHKISPKKAAAG